MATEMTTAIKHLQTTLEVPVLRRKYYADSLDSAKKGQKTAWCSNNIPIEILQAMDVNPVYVENFATVCAAKRLSSAYCQAGERAGFSRDVCGYARITMGFVLGKDDVPEVPYGGLAQPDFMVVSSFGCDSRVGWFGTMSRVMNKPLFVLDAPFQPDGGCANPSNAAYSEGQLREFIAFIEEQTGTKFQPERLRECLDLSRHTNDVEVDIYALRKAVPSPMTAADAYTAAWPGMYIQGTKECEDFYARLKAEIEERIDKKLGVVEPERFRILWSGLPFWYNMRLLNYFEQFGGVVAIENAYYREQRSLPTQDPDPVKDMALASTQRRNFALGIEDRIRLTKEIAQEYKCDGVVLSYNPSCRIFYILQMELKNALDAAGIPTLSLECDMADERTYSEGQVKTRLDAFIEMLT